MERNGRDPALAGQRFGRGKTNPARTAHGYDGPVGGQVGVQQRSRRTLIFQRAVGVNVPASWNPPLLTVLELADIQNGHRLVPREPVL